MKVSTLRQISKFINNLIKCGYDGNTDLEILLADMGYTTLPDNLTNILTRACGCEHGILQLPQFAGVGFSVRNKKMSDALCNTITTTTDIEKLITICDELCIISLTNFIIWLNKPLPRIMDNHIVNYSYGQSCEIASYNTGYKVLGNTKYACTYDDSSNIDILPNCIKNGLYIKNIRYRPRTAYLINAMHITDIEEIDIDYCDDPSKNNLINLNLRTIKSMKLQICMNKYMVYPEISYIMTILPSLESVEINGIEESCAQYHKSDSLYIPILHTVKSLSISHYGLNNIIRDLFGKIRKLTISHCSVNSNDIIPDTVKWLRIVGTNINDAAIRTCTKIKYLNISDRNGITTCAPFAKTLKHLILQCATTMSDDGLALCTNLKILDVHSNNNITTCAPFADSLVVLRADRSCGVCDDGLKLCSKLTTLYAFDNPRIGTCTPFARSLTFLDAGGNCGIGNNGLKLCSKLKILRARDNPNITTCDPFANSLETLDASSHCGLGDNGLKLCTRLKYLDASSNPAITTCVPFASTLMHLFAWNCNKYRLCGITDEGIKSCTKLIELNSTDNVNITLKLPIIYNGE